MTRRQSLAALHWLRVYDRHGVDLYRPTLLYQCLM